MRVELDLLGSGDHLLDPDHSPTHCLDCANRRLHFGSNLGGIGGARAENHLKAGGKLFDRAHEMDDPFLPGDPADEKDVWGARIDAVAFEGTTGLSWSILFEIDPVMNDVDAFLRELK